MEEYRDAAAAAARSLSHEVIRAEDFGSSAETPQTACLAAVRQADVVVLLVGARYGAVQSLGLSATHEEYREARERCPVIVMVQETDQRDVQQDGFLDEVRDWSQGHYTEAFSDAQQLRDAVARALHRLELAQAAGPVDGNEMLQRALGLMPQDRHSTDANLVMVVTGGPSQSVLRPAELENPEFANGLLQQALFGEAAVLDTQEGTETRVTDEGLVLDQPSRSLMLNHQGSIRIVTTLEMPDTGLQVIIEEQVREKIERCLKYAAWLLDHIDPVNRISHCAVTVGILGATYMPWRTRAEHAQSPNQATVGMFGDEQSAPVYLSPPHRTRSALRLEPNRLAEDLTVMLRRRWRT